jgi:sigma-B regulation protein RsbU (phosphoserine phosphatase)
MLERSTSPEATLEIVSPDQPQRLVSVAHSPFLIGRGAETGNHLQLTDRRISRTCAALIADDLGYRLEDRGHRHGIFVNDEKIDQKILQDGDVITFGFDDCDRIVFRFTPREPSIESMLTRLGSIPALTTNKPSGKLGKLNLLLEATALLHSQLPLDSVLGTMLDYAISITNADRGMLLEPSPDGHVRIRQARSSSGENLSPQTLAPSQTVLRQAIEKQTNLVTEDLNSADQNLQAAESILLQRLRAVVAIPLFAMPRANSAESIVLRRGELLGVIYLDSRRSAAFSAIDRQIIDALGMEAASILDNARLVQRERERMRLEQELTIARDIQQALLPQGLRDFPHLGITGVHIPCHAVGGDYYDVFAVDEHRTAILIADVSGKGIGAALLTTMLQGALSGMTIGADPASVFNHINRFLCEHSQVGRYATMFFGLLSRDGTFEYIKAGHPSPLLLRNGEVSELDSTGNFPVGLIAHATFSTTTLKLEPEDTLVLFSDGVTEAEDPKEDLFGVPRLSELIVNQQDTPLDLLQKRILEGVEAFADGASQSDDLTLLLVRYRTAPEAVIPTPAN